MTGVAFSVMVLLYAAFLGKLTLKDGNTTIENVEPLPSAQAEGGVAQFSLPVK